MNRIPKIKLNLEDIPDMKCHCGSEYFHKVYKLKYISPIYAGDKKGATNHRWMWRCLACGYIYFHALPQDEIDEIKKKLQQ